MTRKSAFGLLVVGLGFGFASGVVVGRHRSTRGAIKRAPSAAEVSSTRYRIPIGEAPARGDADAKVTIVEYSDFQCPFCGRVEPALAKVRETFAKKGVRIVWKDSPLPMHADAPLAAEAARAAGEQGRFWEMHDKLFANQKALDRASLSKYASELGLDVAKFEKALDSHRFAAAVQADAAESANFGVHGTPSFFINGRQLRGAQPYESFEKVIQQEIEAADRVLARGVRRADVYEELTRQGLTKAEASKPAANEPDPDIIYKAEVGASPVRGAADAPVTIVIWSDFECPYCAKVEKTLADVRAQYGAKVRLVWKNMPMRAHKNALPAARAAMAAAAQGRFWEMHDLLFASPGHLSREDLDGYARTLGLDMKRFATAMESPDLQRVIDDDVRAAQKLGVRGTPTLFINGKMLQGAQPLAQFANRIDRALEDRRPYEEIIKGARGANSAVRPAVYTVAVADSYSKGPANAPVTIVEFSDFQCPFCGQAERTLSRIMQTYGGKVRLVWKNYPLAFHEYAISAAQAAMAAGEQGKFWPMHDLLFAHQGELDRVSLEQYATQLGLNLAKFRSAIDDGGVNARIEREMKQGNTLDKDIATPTFFINGVRLDGAQPFDRFKEVIDGELSKKHMAAR